MTKQNSAYNVLEKNTNEREETKGTRGPRKDRSGGTYTSDDFLLLPRTEQYELAKDYLCCTANEFDDSGTFSFSQSHFRELCIKLGFEKVTKTYVVDKKQIEEEHIILIEEGKRGKTKEHKIAFSEECEKVYEEIFKGMSTAYRSKVTEAVFYPVLLDLLAEKQKGKLKIRVLREDKILME